MSLAVLQRACLLIAALIGLSSEALGAIRPSFWLDYSSLHATEIVLVRTTQHDGWFDVVDVWKGRLRSGNHVNIPELSPQGDASPIASSPDATAPIGEWDRGRTDIPRNPPGSSMVLFLKFRPDSDPERSSAEDTARTWAAASLLGDFKTSVIWIERGRAYAFCQVTNPGPSILTPLDSSLPETKERVAQIGRMHQDLEFAITNKVGADRAMHLKGYLLSDSIPVRQFALKELGQSGPSATTAIRQILDDIAFAEEAPRILRAYVDAGGEAVGADLTARLRQQLTFWQATAPSLRQGWWNETPIPDALRTRYLLTHELVLALRRIKYRPSLAAAIELRNFWRRLPQLNDHSGIDQLIEDCDILIEQLRSH